ncbi:MAG: biotin--[acetyl-CoA-carboxylase] ligase [Clostridia bacterium]|nr:biotin--[acetyl-CoA-carboxylase] ligase [Clostridia bacterium]
MLSFDITRVDEVDSTNRLAREMASAGAPDGTVVVAARQTAGRGRLGRPWQSAGDYGLWLSVVLRPPFEAERGGMIGIGAGIAAARAIRDTTSARAILKWPNDVLIGGEKVAGVLVEGSSVDSQLLWAAVGIGINVCPPEGGFPLELRGIATSLAEHAPAGAPDRDVLLMAVLGQLAVVYDALCQGRVRRIREEASELMQATLGRHVTVTSATERYGGEALTLDDWGRLVIRRDDGNVVSVSSADVSLGSGFPR